MFGGTAFKNQKFSSLKKDCLKRGELFRDPEFPPNNKSLFFSKVDNDIEWKRPKELCKVPKLIVEGVGTDDLNEGELGNAWFVSACSSLVQEPKLWQKVIPNSKEQEWQTEETYAGIFHFQFWRYGAWVDVVVDDLLPTKNNELVFCHSKSKNEFWSALLEKAYAKLYGDYESLVSGFAADALVDFTGGVAEKIKLDSVKTEEEKYNLFNDLTESNENRALITCSNKCSVEENGQVGKNGLIKGHGYGVTDIKHIKVNKGMKAALNTDLLHMVRLRNPWGTQEWNGPWSDGSPEWNNTTSSEREKLGIKFRNEGEFWMTFEDFLDNFTDIGICHFVNTSFFSLKKTWSEGMMHGEWTRGARGTDKDLAGGCSKHPTFLYNPQYVFDVGGQQDSVMVSIEQDDTNIHKQTGAENSAIGFHIMKVEDNRKFRVHLAGPKVVESPFLVTRSVFQKETLQKGRYVIIPSTDNPGIAGRFLLRLYTGGNANPRELTKDCPKSGLCSKGPALVVRIKVIKAEGLDKPVKQNETTDAYAVVKCEGETVKSFFVKNNQNPEWNMSTIFYRKKPDIPITVEIMNRNLLIDDFMGEARIEDNGSESPEIKELKLWGKKKEQDVEKKGKLFIEVTSSCDLTDL